MMIKESKSVCALLPGEGNPRNSEGSFLQLHDGRIIFAYSRYHGNSWGDHADCDVCAIFSSDGGDTFTDKPITLAKASDYGETNIMSVSLVRFANGDAGLIFLLKRKGLTSEIIVKRSSDEFASFDSEVTVAPQGYPAYYVINNDRITRLSDGRLVIPAAKHPSSIFYKEGEEPMFDGRAQCVFFTSADDGRTWQQDWSIINMPNSSYSNSGLQEPGIIELPNGVLYAYFRTDLMMHYESVSIDGGKHWWNAQPSRFIGPCSPLEIRQNPFSGKYYALWNPIPEYPGRNCASQSWTGGRNPFVIAESDDGYNFGKFEVIEDDDDRGFCYPAMLFTDANTLLIAYCSGGTPDGACLNKTTIRKLILE